jgi:hypothetical protein
MAGIGFTKLISSLADLPRLVNQIEVRTVINALMNWMFQRFCFALHKTSLRSNLSPVAERLLI